MQYWGITDPGCARTQNQDAYHVEQLNKNTLLCRVFFRVSKKLQTAKMHMGGLELFLFWEKAMLIGYFRASKWK